MDTSLPVGVLSLWIDKMDCPTEEALIQKKRGKLEGVEALDFNLMQRRLTVRHHLQDTSSIIDALTAIDLAPTLEANTEQKPSKSRAAMPMRTWLSLPSITWTARLKKG